MLLVKKPRREEKSSHGETRKELNFPKDRHHIRKPVLETPSNPGG